MGRLTGSDGKQSRIRGAIGLTSAFAVAMALATSPLTASVFAAPAEQLGPTETFTGMVVPCSEYEINNATRYKIERPSKTQAGQLEQLDVETPGNPSIIRGYEMLNLTGNYDTPVKTFRTTSLASIGRAATGSFPGCSQQSIDDRNSNGNDNSDGGDDNDNSDDNDNGGGNDDNDNGGNGGDGNGDDNDND